MRFLFDQNISHRILSGLPEDFAGSTSVKREGLLNATDKEVWEFAKANNYIIVTQDSDYKDLNLLYGFPPKIIWIRAGNLPTQAIIDILINYSTEIKEFLTHKEHGCFIIRFIR